MNHGFLLLEIGLEELPAIPLLKELPNISTKWEAQLRSSNLSCSFSLFFTPRRVVLWHESFPISQPDSTEEFFGPPLEVAFKDGVPTKAAESFAKKCAVELSEIEKKEHQGKTVLYYSKAKEGKKSSELLEGIINSFLSDLQFGKAMRWGALSESFIRPVRWMICMLDGKFLPISSYGITAQNFTFGHRGLGHEKLEIDSPQSYFETLLKNGVILNQDERKSKILDQIAKLEKDNGVEVELDGDLLSEIIAITEYPTPLLGSFEERFLELPPEVILTSMKEHQRYFGVKKNGKLTNNFVVVSNAHANNFSNVISGNQKVLRARLSDALFFWHNDLKRGLDPSPLSQILFAEGLGSLLEKVEREIHISLSLLNLWNERLSTESGIESSELKALIERATRLSKADLLSEMVYEFTELQGTMGSYYAKEAKEHDLIVQAINDQYLPKGEDSALPFNLFSSIISLSHKIDNLLAMFSANRLPTGTKDPFALRRAAIGVLRIIQQNRLNFDLKNFLESVSSHYKNFDLNLLVEFFTERYYAMIPCNPSIIKAVLSSRETDLLKIFDKIDALSKIVLEDGFKERFSTFKRVANILKEGTSEDSKIEESLLLESAEKALYEKFVAIGKDSKNTNNYHQKLTLLFSIKPELDSFFDSVMVNAEDLALRNNRRNLVANIYTALLDIADIKEISL